MTKSMCHHGILFIIHTSLVKLSFHAKKQIKKTAAFKIFLEKGNKQKPTVECKL